MIGIDPGPFSLRELLWMTSERMNRLGDCLGYHLAVIIQMISGEKVNPINLNPWRPLKPKSPAQLAEEKREFWARMQVGLFGKKVW